MAHPYAKFRQGNVERARAGALTSEAKSFTDNASDISSIKKSLGDIGGTKAAMRMDRPQRASGGKVKKSGTTVVNVITGGQQQPAPPPMPMSPPPGPPPVPPGPPGPPPGGPPPGAMGPGGPMAGPPPGMPMRASGGGVKSKGMDVGTKVQHDKAKAIDIKNMNRPRVVTFNTGGGVKSFMTGGGVKGVVLKGGTPKTADQDSKLPGGSGGGKGRLAKAHKR